MSHDAASPDELIAEDWPTYYTQVPVWILLGCRTAQAYRLYAFLAEHVNNRTPGQRIACPSTKAIARALGLSDGRRTKPYRDELEDLGAMVVQEIRYASGMRRSFRYFLRFNPPAGYRGPRALSQFYDANPDVRSAPVQGRVRAALTAVPAADGGADSGESTGQPGRAENRTSGGAENRTVHGGEFRAAHGAVERTAELDQQQPHHGEIDQDGGAPSARSAGERRRPSTGSRGRGDDGGCAAASDHGVAQLLTGDERQVLEAYPVALRAVLLTQRRTVPKTLLQEIQRQLRQWPVDRLRSRVQRRWETHRYRELFEKGELRRPVGAAVAMLRPGKCPVDMCEDGVLWHSGEPCRACVERRKDSRAARRESVICPGCSEDRGTGGGVCGPCTDRFTAGVEEACERGARGVADPLRAAEVRRRVADAAAAAGREMRERGASDLGVLMATQLAASEAASRVPRVVDEPEVGPQAAGPGREEAS